MKNEQLRDSRAVEEFLAMKNFITFEMSQEMKALSEAQGKIDAKLANADDVAQTLTPHDLDAIGGKQAASSRNAHNALEGVTKQTTGISNKVRFADENSVDGAPEDDLEAHVAARNMDAGFDTARTDGADGQTTDRAMLKNDVDVEPSRNDVPADS